MKKRLILSMTIIGLFGLMALATSPKREMPPAATKTEVRAEPAPPAPPPKPQAVSLPAMLEEYRNNQVRADETYKDRVVRVEGHVWEVKKGLLDEIFVTVGPTKKWQVPMAACFVPDAAAARPFNKGDAVVAEGRVDGQFVNVLLRDCTLTKR